MSTEERLQSEVMTENRKELVADIAPFGLRMPSDLKARIARTAAGNNRSMNSEILSILEREFPASEPVIDSINRVHHMVLEMHVVAGKYTYEDIFAEFKGILSDFPSGPVDGWTDEITDKFNLIFQFISAQQANPYDPAVEAARLEDESESTDD